LPRAAAPILSLASGTYSNPQTVSMTDTTPGAVIYYTTNGTYPGTTSSVYSTPITVSALEIVVAVAIAPGYDNSPWAIGRYFVNSSPTRWIYAVAGNGSPGYSGDGAQATLAQLSAPQGAAIDATGNIYIADAGNSVVRRVDAVTRAITTIAGTGISGHTGDGGPATSAEIDAPNFIAIDSSGNVFICGLKENVVRKIAAGTGIITTYAGGGTQPGNGELATLAFLNYLNGLATDTQGNLYIDEGFQIRKVTASTGIISTVAGPGATYGDNGPATSASFYSRGIAVDHSGNIYIADYNNNAIRKVTAGTGIITTIAGGPLATVTFGDGGLATAARLNLPWAVAVDLSGNVYIADAVDYAIRMVDGSGIITTVAGDWTFESAGGAGDPATSVGVGFVTNLALDNAGNLYYCDDSERVQKITLTVVPSSATPAPVFSLSPGTYAAPEIVSVSDAAPGASVYLSFSNDPPDMVYSGYFGPINVTGSATITAVAVAPGYLPSAPVQAAYTITSPPSSVISTVAGVGYNGFAPSGVLATAAALGNPDGITLDQAGDVYFSERGTNVVRMVSAATGVETIVAGNGTAGFNGDGIAATSSELNTPYGIAVDKAGNVYIADWSNTRVRKVDAVTGLISTVAGPGVSTTLGDGGPATSAYIAFPYAVALDSAGNLYIADSGNNRVRMVSAATGIITTVAGTGTASFSGDGGLATAATLNGPQGLAFDAAGNLYIEDGNNARIRKVTAATGIITTVAGNGIQNSFKDGSLATQTPIYLTQSSLASDAAGNLFFSTFPASVARVDAKTGVLTRVAGNYYAGSSGDGGSATIASIAGSEGVAVDTNGSLYIAEYGGRVRKVTFLGPATPPYFNLAGGTYHTPQTLTLTDAMLGATIYYTYTANGTKPTTASPVYNGPITINTTGVVEAIATVPGYTESAIASKSYVYSALPTTAAPYFNLAGGTYHSPQMLTLTDTTPGAAIHYTTNGTTPTAASTLYAGPITIASTETVQAVAIATGYALSPIASKAYVYSALPPATAPSFSLAGGTYHTPQMLTLTDATPGATIHFTTNGTTPTAASTLYAGPITIASTETVQAVAIATGYSLSPVSSKAYNYVALPLAAAPYFSLAGGHYTTAQMLTLTDSTPGASIYYTTNGTMPTTGSTKYMGPITISTSETVIAIAAASGYTNSNPASKAYVIP
jgi:sugar lactone lactonase YvrE